MKKMIALTAVILSASQFSFADYGPTVTVLKSVEFVGKIAGQAQSEDDTVCKLAMTLSEFTNADHPDGPVKYQYVNFRLSTGRNPSDLKSKPSSMSNIISRTNATTTYSNESALPLHEGTYDGSTYDGSTLYAKIKRGDATYTGKTEIWIENVSANVFDQKPSAVRVLMKGGTFFATKTEADYSCQL